MSSTPASFETMSYPKITSMQQTVPVAANKATIQLFEKDVGLRIFMERVRLNADNQFGECDGIRRMADGFLKFAPTCLAVCRN